MYANAFQKLGVGRCRYGLMLTETGFVMDDGVIARLAPDRFHVTTTTGGAPRVLAHMEDYLQTEFTDLEVWLTSTTEQWATIAVQGPKARETIAPLIEGVDLSESAFPHMSACDATVCGVRALLMRVSFSGELGYEINVGSAYGLDVWKAVFAEVEKHGGCAYGTETMHVLRAEKGYVIVGQETDGTTTLADLGLDWAIGKAKPDFVGKRSLSLPDTSRQLRKQLVGLLTEDPSVVLEEGAQVTENAAPPAGSHALGHVTSSYRSATLGRSIALALIEGGRSRMGDKLFVSTTKEAVAAAVAAPCFYDPDGARLAFHSDGAPLAPPAEDAAPPEARTLWLAPRSPLDDATLPWGPRFALADSPPAARFVFRGGEAARAACSAAFGVALPEALGAARASGDRAALWLGPDEWLLIADGESPEALAAAIEAGVETLPHSLVDVSQRQVALAVTGADAARVLGAGCPLDLRPKAFPPGMATRTLFDKAEIVLWRRAETDFRVEVWRSFSPWLTAALTEAARGAPAG